MATLTQEKSAKKKSTRKPATKKQSQTKQAIAVREEPKTLIVNSQSDLTKIADPKEVMVWNYLLATKNQDKLKPEQKLAFIHTAISQNLNPLKREIYAIPYKVMDWVYAPDDPNAKRTGAKAGYVYKETGDYDCSVVTGYEVYLKRAQRDPRYKGYKPETIEKYVTAIDDYGNVIMNQQTGKPQMKVDIVAKCTIYRKGLPDFVHEVYLSEYRQNNSMWKSKPHTMIKKVAVAQAHRLCYTEQCDGLPYIFEELPNLGEQLQIEAKEEPIQIIPEIPSEEIKMTETQIKEAVKILGWKVPDLNQFVAGLFPGNDNYKELSHQQKITLAGKLNEQIDKDSSKG